MEKVIVIGGSAGSFKIVNHLFATVNPDPRFAFILCLHRLRNVRSGFVEALSVSSKLPIREPFDKEAIKPGYAFLSPANYHLMIEYGLTFSLSVDAPVNHSRPSIDICMMTAGQVLRKKVIGILLSGANADGAAGLKRIHELGGTTIVQEPADSEIKLMPQSALNIFKPTFVLSADKIIKFIRDL